MCERVCEREKTDGLLIIKPNHVLHNVCLLIIIMMANNLKDT